MLMLQILNDAVDYMEYDPSRSKTLIKRVMYWLEEEETSGGEEKEASTNCDW